MKQFNTLQQLMDYGSYCSYCQKISQEIIITAKPTVYYQLRHFHKQDQQLTLLCDIFYQTSAERIQLDINCLDNTFQVSINGYLTIDGSPITDRHFEFIVSNRCPECFYSLNCSMPLTINYVDLKINNIEMSYETVYVDLNNYTYKICNSYDTDSTTIDEGTVRLGYTKNHKTFVASGKFMKIPLLNLDFHNYQSIVNKLKTILLFS